MSYVDKEHILAKCEEMWNNADETTQTGVDTINAIDRITDYIESLPAINARPMSFGSWECVGHDDNNNWYRCTVCGHEEHDNMTKHDKFCSSCGSYMQDVTDLIANEIYTFTAIPSEMLDKSSATEIVIKEKHRLLTGEYDK